MITSHDVQGIGSANYAVKKFATANRSVGGEEDGLILLPVPLC